MSAFAPAAAAVALAIYAPWARFSLILCVPIVAALAAVVAYPPVAAGEYGGGGPSRRVAATLLVCSVAAAVGLAAASVIGRGGAAALPLDRTRVTWLEGRVDQVLPEFGSSDGLIVVLRLTRAGSEFVTGTASGRVRVTVSPGAVSGRSEASGGWYDAPPGRRVAPGALVEVDLEAPLWSGETGTGGRAAAVRIKRSGVRPAIHAAVSAALDRATGRASGLVRALLLGDREALDPWLSDLFRRSGASHLLALSGMHLGVIVLLCSVLLRPVVGRRVTPWIACGLAVAYTVIIGARPSLVRSTILCVVALALSRSGRPLRLLELLAACFFLQVVVWPEHAPELAYQLSYLSLVGIAVAGPVLAESVPGSLPRAMVLPLAAGVAAQLATGPLVLTTFGVVYPVGVVTAIALTPLITVLMIAALGGAVLVAAGVRPGLLVPVFELLYDWCESLARVFARAPAIHNDGIGVSLTVVTVSLITLTVGLVHEWRQVRWTGV